MTFSDFKRHFRLTLNPQQEEAVRQTGGPVLLLAVPGSGKTTVLVARLGYMLYCQGVRPEQILTVTYTVAATRDMRRRFSAAFGEEYAGRLTFRTINGICAVVIRHYAARKGARAFTLADDEGQLNAVVRELLAKSGSSYPSELQVKDARTHITFCKNRMLTEAEIREHKVDGMDFPAVWAGYQDFLNRSRLMDYDDQMVFTYRIFRQHPDILAHFRQRYPYLCVDEAQDTSKIQHAILRLLSAGSGNIFMVGDEDQSIYGFRAAWPQALLEFERTYPGARVLVMDVNYRSTRAIVDKADAFIQRNRDRHPKHMRTGNPQGAPVRKIVLPDYNRQYRYLLGEARACTQPTAILYRNNDSALPLIDLLEQNGVPYACRQREGFFFTSPLVRDLTDMLEFAFDDGSRELFLRFYYKLDLKVKKAVLAGLLRGMREDETVFDVLLDSGGLEPWQAGKVKALQTHFSKLPRLTSFAALQRLVKYMGYGDYLKEQRVDTSKLDVLFSLANQTPGLESFLLRLRELRALLEEPPRADCPLTLSTIHASKGLEYDRVILIDVVDGLFPSVAEPEDEAERAALEEERRLFYVGATRARRQLDLLYCENRFGEPARAGSTFLSQFLGEPPKPPASAAPAPAKADRPAGPPEDQVSAWERDYVPGVEVLHRRFGRGLLQSRTGSIATVSFREGGVRKVDLPTCLRQGLIRLACPE